MILDIKWEIPEDGRGEAKLMALVAEVVEWSERGVPCETGRTEWEEVRVEIKKPNELTQGRLPQKENHE